MSDGPAKRNAWASRAFLVVLAIACVGMSIVGWKIVERVRQSATETDQRLRTLGWAVLAYAASHDGAFPSSDAELKAYGLGGESIAVAPSEDDDPWPTSRSEALAGAAPASLDDCLRSIIVVFGEDRSTPPFLRPDGLPTTVGTGPEVNDWLRAVRAHYLRAAATAAQ